MSSFKEKLSKSGQSVLDARAQNPLIWMMRHY